MAGERLDGSQGGFEYLLKKTCELPEFQVIIYKPSFRNNFRAVGKVLEETLPHEISGGRAPIRPHMIRLSKDYVEIDTLRKDSLHTALIDIQSRTIAYLGSRLPSEEVRGMISEKFNAAKTHALKRFSDVLTEISASLQNASGSSAN